MTKSRRTHPSRGADPAGDYARLVRQAAGGDRTAMEDLLVRAQETAYRFSLLVCGHAEDAEDVMQDALLKTYRHVGRIRQPEAFRTWLYSTVRNECLMKRRVRAGEPRHVLSLDGHHDRSGDTNETARLDVKDTGKGPDELAMDAWIGERLRRALATLAAPFRTIIVLREMEGLSTREVAKVLGISEANVKTRLHRAHMKLKKALEES